GNVWEGLFSAAHYAALHCGILAHEVRRTVCHLPARTFVFCHFYRYRAAEPLDLDYARLNTHDGYVCPRYGYDLFFPYDEIQRPYFSPDLRSAALYVSHTGGLPHFCLAGKIP